jgi:peptidoglycan DL-endopeptidase CwlO
MVKFTRKMQQKQTRTTSRTSLFTRVKLVIVAATIAITVPASFSPSARADQYDQRIQELQNAIDQYQAKAQALHTQADTLQSAVDSLNADISTIQTQINLNQAKVDQLTAQITDSQQRIDLSQDDLGKTIANIYVDDKISPLEMLASSKSIGEYVDKQEYRASVRDHLTSTISEIKKLKQQLEKQKSDVEFVLAQQHDAQSALDGKRAQQQQLLDQTRGNEASYQQLTADNKARQAQIRQEQQAAIEAAIARTGGATVLAAGVDGAYPWNNGNCPMVSYFSTGGADGNGGDGYGYGCRQCASYAAWRVAKETGRYPAYWGNATNFPARARAAGYSTGYTPRAGSLAVMHATSAGVPEGHVAWVEAVIDGGSSIVVSQYNYNYGAGYGMYSKMKLSTAAFDEFVYIL